MSLNLPHKRIGVGVIRNQHNLILIDRRQQKGSMGGLWEFPGGKIEPNETVQECIAREISEELAIEIAVETLLIEIEHTYPQYHITLYVYNCRYIKGEPQPLECDEIRWVKPHELEQYEFPAANAAIVAALHKKLNRSI
jgi:mutator protein MutT